MIKNKLIRSVSLFGFSLLILGAQNSCKSRNFNTFANNTDSAPAKIHLDFKKVINKLLSLESRPAPVEFIDELEGRWPTGVYFPTDFPLSISETDETKAFDGWLQDGGVVSIIEDLEKFYPGGMYIFMGRDSADIGDAVDLAYLKMGQRCRVIRLGVSKNSWWNDNGDAKTYDAMKESLGSLISSGESLLHKTQKNHLPECAPRLLDYVDASQIAPPVVVVDSTRYLEAGGSGVAKGDPSQARQIVMAIYDYIKANSTEKMVPDFDALTSKIGMFDLGNLQSNAPKADEVIPEDYFKSIRQEFEFNSSTLFYPQKFIQQKKRIGSGKGYGNSWHGKFSTILSKEIEGNRIFFTSIDPKDEAPSNPSYVRKNVLNIWIKTMMWLNKKENLESIQKFARPYDLQSSRGWFRTVNFPEAFVHHIPLELIKSATAADGRTYNIFDLAEQKLSSQDLANSLESLELYTQNTEVLHLKKTEMTNGKLEIFAKVLPQMRELDLRENKLESIDALVKLSPRLEDIKLDYNPSLKLAGLRVAIDIANLGKLQNLSLKDTGQKQSSQTAFSKSASLKSLDLSNNSEFDPSTLFRDGLSEMETLDLSKTALESLDRISPRTFPKLKELNVSQTKLSISELTKWAAKISSQGTFASLEKLTIGGEYKTALEKARFIDLLHPNRCHKSLEKISSVKYVCIRSK